MIVNGFLLLATLFVIYLICRKEREQFTVLKTYPNISNASQGVAVGPRHFFALDTTSITKHDLLSGETKKHVTFPNHERIKHMNSGVVVGDLLYVCNNPTDPQFNYNTLEVFDLDLNHKFYVEIQGNTGSLVAVDYYQGRWWGCFAFEGDEGRNTVIAEMYHPFPDNSKYGKLHKKDLVRWHIRNRFYFPEKVYQHMYPRTISGFSFGPTGQIYASAEGTSELYVIHLNYHATVMSLDDILETGLQGQSIDWDRNRKLLFGVNSKTKKVIMYSD